MNIILNNKKINIFAVLSISALCFIPISSYAFIVTIFKPLGFIASAISNGVTPVEVIIPDGTSAHNYALRPYDVMKIKHSDFVILIGDNAEPFFIKKIINNLKKKNIELSSIDKIRSYMICHSKCFINQKKQKKTLQNHKEINNILYDMHLWLSPQIALESAIVIHDMLIETRPQKKILIDNNLKDFRLNLLQLNQNIQKKLAFFHKKKYFIFHDAYKYFEKYYQLNPIKYIKKYPGINTGARSLYDIKQTLLRKRAVCIFTEPQFNLNIINTIIRGTNIHKGILDPRGINISLSKDSYLQFLLQLSNQYVSCFKNLKE